MINVFIMLVPIFRVKAVPQDRQVLPSNQSFAKEISPNAMAKEI